MLIIVAPDADALPITVAQAREHCRGPENGDDDALIERALRAAIEFAQNHTSLVLRGTTYQYRRDAWPCGSEWTIEIPLAPVRDVVAVTYIDEAGIEQTVDAGDWTWERTAEGAIITFGDDFDAPDLKTARKGAVRVEFEAGFDAAALTGSGDDPDLRLPDLARIAVLMLTEHFYENRGAVAFDQSHRIELAAVTILDQLRVYR